MPSSKLSQTFAHFYPWFVSIGLVGYVVFSLCVLKWASETSIVKSEVDKFVLEMDHKEILLSIASLAIFLFTFLLFVNWGYRLIFLIPLFLVLSRATGLVLTVLRYLILVIMWIPVIPLGWVLTCLFTYLLALGLGFLAIRILLLHSRLMHSGFLSFNATAPSKPSAPITPNH
jgi:hypothetical protein